MPSTLKGSPSLVKERPASIQKTLIFPTDHAQFRNNFPCRDPDPEANPPENGRKLVQDLATSGIVYAIS